MHRNTFLAWACCLSAVTVLGGCGQKRVAVATPAPRSRPDDAYVDLEAGWRLRVVMPLRNSGTKISAEAPQQSSGNTLTVVAGKDFLGYETDYYDVASSGRGGVKVRFRSAEITSDGQMVRQTFPTMKLFVVPRHAIFLRLLYLERGSEADHNMAVVGANRKDRLEQLTQSVEADPANCAVSGATVCRWMTAGVAVRPEVTKAVSGVEQWVPAR
jgi:hypothetical protein